MTPLGKTQYVALGITLIIVVSIGLLVFYLPGVAAILFVALAIFLAIFAGRKRGFWRGFLAFIKNILFGW